MLFVQPSSALLPNQNLNSCPFQNFCFTPVSAASLPVEYATVDGMLVIIILMYKLGFFYESEK